MAIAFIAWRERNPERHWKTIWALSLIGLVYSIYLTVIAYTVLQAACFYCLVSLGLLSAIFLISLIQHPKGMPQFSWPAWIAQTGILALVLVGALHMHYSGVFDPEAGPENPRLRAIASHLEQSGAVFYGAYW